MLNKRKFHILVVGLVLTLHLIGGCGQEKDPDLPSVATPSQPYTVVSSSPTRGIANDIALLGDQLYVAENGFGIARYDVSDLSSPELEYQYSTDLRPLYLTLAPWNNFLIVGFEDRYQVLLLGDTLTYTSFIEYLTAEDLIVLPDSSQQFSIVEGELKDIVGTRLIRADNIEGFNSVYIYPDSTSNPPDDYRVGNNIIRVRTNRYGAGALAITPIDSFYTLAVGLKDVGVGFLAMGEEVDPGQTAWLSDVDTPGEATGLIHQDGYVYVADGLAGLSVIDAQDLANPALTSNWTYPGLGHANKVALHGNHLVLLDRFDGAFFFDLTNPAEPEYMGMLDVREPTGAVFTDSGELIVSSVTEGLTVLQLLY